MKLNDKVYTFLKWFTLVFLPAATTFAGIILPAVGVDAELTQTIITVTSATTAFLGAVLGVSTAEYRKAENAEKEADTDRNPDEV